MKLTVTLKFSWFWLLKGYKKLFLRSRDSQDDISDYSGNRTDNHLVHKRKLDHLAKLVN